MTTAEALMMSDQLLFIPKLIVALVMAYLIHEMIVDHIDGNGPPDGFV